MVENNIIMEEVLEVGIEEEINEVKDVLDLHKQTLKTHEDKLYNHDEKIQLLEIKGAGYAERFNSIDTTLARVENTTLQNLQTSNLLINTISQIAIGNSTGNTEIKKQELISDTEIKKIKLHNNLSMALKIIGIVSLLITSIVAVKYGITIK